ncbi:hypothetical protein BDN72DRAFT_836432 [Pluteus cervinus]|uniref:Uncharacterized protein n=1 Tax=Pluteus cervinus TaxID=181527 RepID=A0ACD3B311_9AGAR|nr:hypothetical protein BDN72DRAFT_836432 [Pluteus cervinus]
MALKGRRRFNADFDELKEESKRGLVIQELRVSKFRAGDDEGSIEVAIADAHGKTILTAHLLVSETSDYPDSHSIFCYSDDSLSGPLQSVIEDVASGSPKPLRDTISSLVTKIAKSLSKKPPTRQDSMQSEDVDMEDDDDDGDEAAYLTDDDDFGLAGARDLQKLRHDVLQRDFIDIVGTGYRPGFLSYHGDDFGISISYPVVRLAESIPPQALMAWDRRLLSRHQHLTVLISGTRGIYPFIDNMGRLVPAAVSLSANISFKVGITRKYKPSREQAMEAGRTFGLIVDDAEDEFQKQAEKAALEAAAMAEWEDDPYFEDNVDQIKDAQEELVDEEEENGKIDKFSLSSSLESLLDQAFLKVVQLRREFGLGWAGAEVLYFEMEKSQVRPEEIMRLSGHEIHAADKEENKLAQTNKLPHDPLAGLSKNSEINLPLTAFCYLVRRLTLCTRHCIVCHNKLTANYDALKPYVCDNKLCTYQYYSLNRGPSLEYEIVHNPEAVDLLVSIAYSSAVEQSMEEPLPKGMGLRVPLPDAAKAGAAPTTYQNRQQVQTTWTTGDLPIPDIYGLVDFDDLPVHLMRVAIVDLIDSLPAVDAMRKHLMKKVKAGKSKPKLKDADPAVLPGAWLVLRWIVASCTAYIEEITSGEERIKNLDPVWRQFRFSVGAPDAEAKFKNAVQEAQASNANAKKFPALYAFHGSPLRNWHSIIRHGLWYKVVANGRAYGDGVYLAKDGTVSGGHYAMAGRSWKKSKVGPTSCMALAEVVNLPAKFVSQNPYLVVKDTHWIMCRYLLVKGIQTYDDGGSSTSTSRIPFVSLDPAHATTFSNKPIQIPDPSYQISSVIEARNSDYIYEENDHADVAVFDWVAPPPVKASQSQVIEISDDEDYHVPASHHAKRKQETQQLQKAKNRPKDDWQHNAEWVGEHVGRMMPPPSDANPSATMAVQRELKAMLKEQEVADSLRDLGWYMPEEFIGDNLFQWIVELHSFDPALPVAKDMKAKGVNSLVFEIRFPPAFPNSPPFFRVITPRFLPFIHGGGGHITGGGSICMDLLTADGWLPSYSIAAVLLQIKLAISSLDPRPARLASNWNQPYTPYEALEGYKRAAATHNWTVPAGLDKLVR